ncbi:MAG TPA: DUF3857 and transglutaminase domain-containing protein [Pyrinomonadaceae bacterium]|nr:DUF3857 and transglutaminase domain-containing protein [Pyrinomonadaceae bacterium]
MNLSFKKHSLVLFLSFSLLVCLQTVFAGDEPWREITPAELQSKTPKVEADADAEAIFWEIRIDDSSSEELSMKHYVRVKIFTERGREKYSKFDIPFIKGEKKIKDIAARVIKADGTIIELTPKDIFEREIINANKVKVRAKSFAVPNIEPGVIIEYRYKEVIEDAGANGMTLEFQKDIPIQTLSYYYKPYNKREPSAQSYNFSDTRFLKNEKGFYLAERTNIPAFKEEPRMPPANNVRPWMQLQGVSLNITSISAFSIGFSIKDPSNMGLYWGSVAGEKVSLVKYMNKPDKEIKKVATEITTGATTDEEKLRKLYDFCQTQIRNVSFDPTATDEDKQKAFKQKELTDALKSKSTDAGYLNILFGSMANSLGFDTRIAYSGNRSKMFFEPPMTNEGFIHRAAIAVRVGEDWKFFDPGTPFLPYGMLVWYEEDVWALVVGEKQHGWVKTPMTGTDKSVAKRTGKFKLAEDGTLEGDVRIEYTGQSALTARLDIYEDSPAKREENFKEEIKQRISTAEVSNITIENITDISKPLVYQYKIRVPNYAQKTGKRIFFQPGFFEYGETPLFAGATRKYDIYFQYPWSENDEIEIALPAGFALDSAERPAEIADSSKIGRLKIDIGVDKDQTLMKYNRQFHFGGGGNILFAANVYQPLKNLFDEFQKNDSHTITLKQK